MSRRRREARCSRESRWCSHVGAEIDIHPGSDMTHLVGLGEQRPSSQIWMARVNSTALVEQTRGTPIQVQP